MSNSYAPLFRPLTIGGMTVKNRFAVAPLSLPSLYGPYGEFSADGLAFHEARARGGFGLLFTSAFHPYTETDPVHPYDTKPPMKAPKTFLRAAVEMNERLDAYGTKMIPQISIGYGRNTLGCVAPSEIPYYADPSRMAPAITKDQIKYKIDKVIETAAFFQKCGFQGVEMHAMHWGYLLDEFAMTLTNHRTDEYGGSLENRLRVAKELVEGIKAACGSTFAVSMRLALKTYMKGFNQASLHGEDEAGRTLEEGIAIAKKLEAYGYDCLSVDFGQYDSFYYAAPPCYMEKGGILRLAEQAKAAVNIPVLCSGRMNDPDLAAQAVKEGRVDGVVLGRQALADPAFPQKLAKGLPQEIRPCIGCNQGCIGALMTGRRVGCAVNPQAGREFSRPLLPAAERKQILVIGGGVAGMEAAQTAAKRGHTVTLCESSDHLGGNLIPAGAHDFKAEMNELNTWYQRQLEKQGITVQLNTTMDAASIKKSAPDAVILAVGADPVIPPVPGIEKAIDCTAALTGTPVGDRVVVIGGGLVGCETALGYAREGKTVTIVEALPDILSAGIKVPVMNEQLLRDLLQEARVTLKTGCRLSAVGSDSVTVSTRMGEETIPADSVVLAVGFRSRKSLMDELADCELEVYQIGDGNKVGNVMTAIDTAYTVARSL